jgi:alpha/beta superfamily hydrolase
VEIAVVAVQIEKLHLQIEKQEKEDHVKVVKLQKVVAVKVKADVEAVAIKIVNHFFNFNTKRLENPGVLY